MADALPPVIAIDGPSASGKGTIARQVAQRLGFHCLDSGALYRLAALAALQRSTALDDEPALACIAGALDIAYSGEKFCLDHKDVTDQIRTETVGAAASAIAALPAVRRALFERQRAFRQPPGLVAEGRDMGTVVFPDAVLKIYLTASAGERAQRRYNQLKEKGLDANMSALLQDIRQRDTRDSARAAAPLQKSADAELLDTTSVPVATVVAQVLARYAALKRLP
ncbi:MAG TPA: (d)CMP kinase [Burkholderiales bacterium]|nr:(d)CMP kinase [Burkholderiales bacterium]